MESSKKNKVKIPEVSKETTSTTKTPKTDAKILDEAIKILENDSLYKNTVRIQNSMRIPVQPGNTLELRGSVKSEKSSWKIIPRKKEQLPVGISIEIAETCDNGNTVRIVLKNNSRRAVDIDSSVVLAEVHTSQDVDALVGPSLEAWCQIDGKKARCLVDTGSQVSIMSESFFRKNYSKDDLEPLSELNVTGAGGHSIPYLGFVRVNVELPEEVVGVREKTQTLMLVCPDTEYSILVPVIVGTNTMRNFASICRQMVGKSFATTVPVTDEVAFLYKDLIENTDGKIGSAKLKGNIVVPAGETVETTCMTKVRAPCTRDSVLIQEPVEKMLPEGLKVIACKVSADHLSRLKIFVCNDSEHDILLKKNQIVADVFVFQSEYDVKKVFEALSNDEEGLCQDEVDSDGKRSKENVHSLSTNARTGQESEKREINFKLGEGLPDDFSKSFSEKLQSYSDVFIHSEFDIGRCQTGHVFDIELEPGPPVKQRARPVPPQDFDDLRKHIQGLLDAKLIYPSISPYASPIVLCRKRSGKLRMVCDYRMINARTVGDSYSVPKIEDLLMTLSGAKYFCQLDLSNAFMQIPISERASKISAITTVFGNFAWDRMPQGLKNAAPFFQRVVEFVFRDMNLVEMVLFIDDVLLHAKTLDELEERTFRALDKLRKYNLKLDAEKCLFGVTEVKHLGFVISANGEIRPDPEKVSAVTTWPKPKTVKEVKSFTGFCGVYRRFIPEFSEIIKPLNDITKGYCPTKCKSKSGKRDSDVLSLTSDISHLWGIKHDKAFEKLKEALTGDLVLGIADRSKPFFLHCDASLTGIGGVLYQQDIEENMKVIAYASRGLNKSEQNYPAHKREFLALKWCMSEKFKDYLLGSKVTVVTDNNPLCYILKNAKLDALSHRWLASLSIFDFDLKYKRGSTHTDADALSRRPQKQPEEDEDYKRQLEKIAFLTEKARAFGETDFSEISSESVQAIMQAHFIVRTVHSCHTVNMEKDNFKGKNIDENDQYIPVMTQNLKDPSLIPDDILEPKEQNMASISSEEWRKFQLADKNVGYVVKMIEENKSLVASEMKNQELKVFAREQKKLVMKEGVLYRKVNGDESERLQLVLPYSHRRRALMGVHEDLFHTHYDDAIIHLRQRFFWPYMARDLERKIKRCGRCIMKGAKPQKAEMQGVDATYPLELLSIDFLTIEVKGIKQNILVVMDVFTKFATAILTKDQKAKTVANALWKQFFMIYGFPSRILSDQGRDFESNLIREVCQLAGIDKCRTTPYHPSSNPVERFNRSIISMLRSLELDQKVDWRKHLPAAVHAYNCCIHQTTGFCPYYLFFGRAPRLPIDLAFGIDVEKKTSGSSIQYIQNLKKQLKTAYEKALENSKKARESNKARYDSSAFAAELMPGDRVLVRRLGLKLDSKISDRWEEKAYVVISRAEGLPVYKVQVEKGEGPIRTLHRNHLFPIGMLDCESSTTKNERKNTHWEAKNKTKEQSKDLKSPDQFSDLEDETFYEVEYVQTSKPHSKLRVNAPEFIPASLGKPIEIVTVEDTRGCADISSKQQGSDELSVSLDEQFLEDAENSLVSEGSDFVDEEGQFNITDTSNPELEEGEKVQTQESQMLRRSTRIRKPPDRLNLVHKAKTIDTENVARFSQSDLCVIQGQIEHFLQKDILDRDLKDCLETMKSVIHYCGTLTK